MASRYVALLRGVNNIGATRRVSMAELRDAIEELGFQGVRTLLNSGNVLFSVPGRPSRREVLDRVETALRSRLGLACTVTLLGPDELAAIVRDNPFSQVATRPSDMLVVVPRTTADLARLQPLCDERWEPDQLALGEHVAYLWCANSIAKSRLRIAVERELGPSGTGRNIATLTKVMAALRNLPS